MANVSLMSTRQLAQTNLQNGKRLPGRVPFQADALAANGAVKPVPTRSDPPGRRRDDLLNELALAVENVHDARAAARRDVLAVWVPRINDRALAMVFGIDGQNALLQQPHQQTPGQVSRWL